jgi:hypothetical protein
MQKKNLKSRFASKTWKIKVGPIFIYLQQIKRRRKGA